LALQIFKLGVWDENLVLHPKLNAQPGYYWDDGPSLSPQELDELQEAGRLDDYEEAQDADEAAEIIDDVL
jgi:hypothetical protein